MKLFAVLFATITFLHSAFAEFKAAYVCSACTIVLGLVEQAGLQIRLETYLKSQCTNKLCEQSVHQLILAAVAQLSPDVLCSSEGLNVCPNTNLFSKWPVDPLPAQPTEWPVERKLPSADVDISLDLIKNLKPVFESIVGDVKQIEGMPLLAQVSSFLAKINKELSGVKAIEEYEPCGFNISCKIDAIVDHKPIQDKDGDRYSTMKRLRGTDWRGVDCDDSRSDVYPGRKLAPKGIASKKELAEIDHNCNGIVGSNSSGSFEDIFCSNIETRGLIMLGDSATAHFHIPSQWVTAAGWNLKGLLPAAENEIDYPMCSWGTGHVTPEECPYQHEIDGVTGITSLYTQLRARNRCSHNDYQNIGVNGARMGSSDGLINAMAREANLDNPALVWLSLIGNDVCNGHPNFDSMTKPAEFYDKTMEALNSLDKLLPKGSHVVSLALFEGELLYDIMHDKQHPIGCTYLDIYTFMNDLEENPCWGWLNGNATVRRTTTQRAHELNDVYRKIQKTAKFENFDYIFYDPVWTSLFLDYEKAGNQLLDLIEPTDGFHPSQTGNAIFAQKFWQFLESEHPEALGPVNPHNAEIDSLFFTK